MYLLIPQWTNAIIMLLLVTCFRSPFDLSAKRGLRKDMHKNYTSSVHRTEPLISIRYLQNTRLRRWLECTGIYCWPTVFNIWKPYSGETPVVDFRLVVQTDLTFEVWIGAHKVTPLDYTYEWNFTSDILASWSNFSNIIHVSNRKNTPPHMVMALKWQ